MDTYYIPSAKEIKPNSGPLTNGKTFLGNIGDGSPAEISVPFENTKQAEVTNVKIKVKVTTPGKTESVQILVEGTRKTKGNTEIDRSSWFSASNTEQTVPLVNGNVSEKVTGLFITVKTTASTPFAIKVTLESIEACFKRKS